MGMWVLLTIPMTIAVAVITLSAQAQRASQEHQNRIEPAFLLPDPPGKASYLGATGTAIEELAQWVITSTPTE